MAYTYSYGRSCAPFGKSEEELAYLREQVAAKEQELAAMRDSSPREVVIQERILHHRDSPATVLAPQYQQSEADIRTIALNLDPDDTDETIAELRAIMEEKGVKNALAVLEKIDSPHIKDDFHRFLVQYIAPA